MADGTWIYSWWITWNYQATISGGNLYSNASQIFNGFTHIFTFIRRICVCANRTESGDGWLHFLRYDFDFRDKLVYGNVSTWNNCIITLKSFEFSNLYTRWPLVQSCIHRSTNKSRISGQLLSYKKSKLSHFVFFFFSHCHKLSSNVACIFYSIVNSPQFDVIKFLIQCFELSGPPSTPFFSIQTCIFYDIFRNTFSRWIHYFSGSVKFKCLLCFGSYKSISPMPLASVE